MKSSDLIYYMFIYLFQGRFDIISLCGSYVRADFESRSGGLSICLCSNDGQIIGGGVDGPLIAAGPVQVTFTSSNLA